MDGRLLFLFDVTFTLSVQNTLSVEDIVSDVKTSKPDVYPSLLKCSYLCNVWTICFEILRSESHTPCYCDQENRIQIWLPFADLWSIRFPPFFRTKTLATMCAFYHVAARSIFLGVKVLKLIQNLLKYEAKDAQLYQVKQFFQATILQKVSWTSFSPLFWAWKSCPQQSNYACHSQIFIF